MITALHNPDQRMTEDEIGQHAEQFHCDLALLQHRQAHAVDPNAESAERCEACGNEIPEARRKALPGVMLCVECAREQEHKGKQWR